MDNAVCASLPDGVRRCPWFVILRMVIVVALVHPAADVMASVCQNDASGAAQSTSEKNLKDLSLEELGNVEVTTYNKAPTDLWETPAAVYVITSDDILRSGATSIADALRLAPGVEVGQVSSTTWAVGIRGLQNNFSKSVLVLIDGRNVYTPLFAGTYWDVQDMPLEDIDHIEVIRGPGGTIWGPNAVNGVINIITKSSADTHGVMVDGSFGTVDHTIDDLQFGASTKNLNFRVFGRGFEREHEYHTNRLNADAWHQERMGFRADLTSGPNILFAEGDTYRGQFSSSDWIDSRSTTKLRAATLTCGGSANCMMGLGFLCKATSTELCGTRHCWERHGTRSISTLLSTFDSRESRRSPMAAACTGARTRFSPNTQKLH